MKPKLTELFKQGLTQLRLTGRDSWDMLKNPATRRAAVGVLVVGLLVGWLVKVVLSPAIGVGHTPAAPTVEQSEVIEDWTCAMHPQIHLPEPGQCPICNMDLIPVKQGSQEVSGPRRLVMSPGAKQLASIRTSVVERRLVEKAIRMVGKVEYDETRLADITARVSGRIDRLYVDATGIPVRQGDHLIYLYSPELLSAQEEYLQAQRSVTEVEQSHLEIIRTTSATTVESAREKMRLLGITDEQIAALEVRQKPDDHMTMYAPTGGIVIERSVLEGEYVKTGQRLLSIADLSYVWVQLDAYESDLPWLRFGQAVVFTSEAYPGEQFKGWISFIDPILNEQTRTVKIRVNVENTEQLLKPGMFVRAVVKAHVAHAGKVVDPTLEGQWICPMHPEVTADKRGTCPVCEMQLVPTTELGYTLVEDTELPLVIPATAPLLTGTRAVVYVEVPDTDRPTYEGREVVLGPRAGNYYIVRSGLAEGDRVVTNGNFKIDSALQIQAKPSMMSPAGGPQTSGQQHEGSHNAH